MAIVHFCIDYLAAIVHDVPINRERHMPLANSETVAFLAKRCAGMSDDAVKALQGRAIAAAAIHQARGAFYMAELCEQRAADLLGVIAQRVPA